MRNGCRSDQRKPEPTWAKQPKPFPRSVAISLTKLRVAPQIVMVARRDLGHGNSGRTSCDQSRGCLGPQRSHRLRTAVAQPSGGSAYQHIGGSRRGNLRYLLLPRPRRWKSHPRRRTGRLGDRLPRCWTDVPRRDERARAQYGGHALVFRRSAFSRARAICFMRR